MAKLLGEMEVLGYMTEPMTSNASGIFGTIYILFVKLDEREYRELVIEVANDGYILNVFINVDEIKYLPKEVFEGFIKSIKRHCIELEKAKKGEYIVLDYIFNDNKDTGVWNTLIALNTDDGFKQADFYFKDDTLSVYTDWKDLKNNDVLVGDILKEVLSSINSEIKFVD